jgi:hypothetical protein
MNREHNRSVRNRLWAIISEIFWWLAGVIILLLLIMTFGLKFPEIG